MKNFIVTVNHDDHVHSVRDSVFIGEDGSIVREESFLDKDSCDGGSNDDNQGHTKVIYSKVAEDEDSTEDNVSCDSLDDVR